MIFWILWRYRWAEEIEEEKISFANNNNYSENDNIDNNQVMNVNNDIEQGGINDMENQQLNDENS